VHGVNEVEKTEVYTTEPFVPDPTSFEVDIAVAVLTICQLLIRYSVFIRYWRKNKSTVEQYIRYLWS
jgi:hypothetical protein